MRYGSRKFIISMASIAAAVALAFVEKMTGDVAMVLTAVNVGYHAANAWTTGKGNGNAV